MIHIEHNLNAHIINDTNEMDSRQHHSQPLLAVSQTTLDKSAAVKFATWLLHHGKLSGMFQIALMWNP